MNYLKLNLPPTKDDLEAAQRMIDRKQMEAETGIKVLSMDDFCDMLDEPDKTETIEAVKRLTEWAENKK